MPKASALIPQYLEIYNEITSIFVCFPSYLILSYVNRSMWIIMDFLKRNIHKCEITVTTIFFSSTSFLSEDK